MDGRYKLILFNKNIYKEIELTQDMAELVVGTRMESDVRLHREYFFGHIELHFRKIGQNWSMTCGDEVYFSYGDARKLLAINLRHGDEINVKYNESDHDVFHISFMIDFEYENKDYSREIELDGQSRIRIGNQNGSDIRINDSYITSGEILLSNENGKWWIEDLGMSYGIYINGSKIEKMKELKNHHFFSIVSYSFYYKNNKLYTTANHNMTIQSLRNTINEESKTCLVYPKFNRNTRVQYVIPKDELEIQQPTAKPPRHKRNILFTLIPSLIMLAMVIVLRGFIGGGGTFVIYSALSMSLGIVMSVATYLQDEKQYKKECADRIKSYNQYIEDKTKEIMISRENELRIRRLIYQSLQEGIDEVNSFGRRLFERTKSDKDFLQVYIGTGRVEAFNQVKYTKLELVDAEDDLLQMPEKIHETYKYIENAPIISDFSGSCGVGIVGTRESLFSILKNITLDIAVRHFYGDVKFVYIFGEDGVGDFSWVRWLKNVHNEQLDINNIVCDEESKNAILEFLYLELSTREQQHLQNRETVFEDHYVIFVTDVELINSHPVSKYIGDCNQYGFTFVFFEEYEEKLPLGCTEIIRLENQENNELIKTENGDIVTSFEYKEISDETANHVALKLASIFVDEVNLEGQLTKNITLFELLGIISTEDLNLKDRWNSSTVHTSLAAPLGVKNKNQVVYLDISDKAGAHGPHGLVAGTTGSGKSEILQSYILSMATLFHPYEVGFVIIDFKGGGMSNQFIDLPHLIGTITNIDGREINRSLLSIKAELVKRQEIFMDYGVNHINEYIKLYKAGKAERPLPHLVMIVDEFAELKSEYPDFMKELISAARIGRTLGVHLILATQKPSGVVDAQIWSNSKFKLCLKVQTKEDSNEVIKTPLAAEIVEPGRVYFQVGNNEIFELFQSAYSGAPVPVADEASNRTYSIYEKNVWGKKKLVYTNKKAKVSEKTLSQLKAIVDYVADYCNYQEIYKLPGICLPALPDKIDIESLSYNGNRDVGVNVLVGVYDDPEQQNQGNVIVDFSKENVYIVGSSQMGKTVLLQTMAYGLIKNYTPKQVNIYMIDCGSMVLKIFENSSHVGGIVLSNEDEKCKNLFKMLNSIVMERKRILSDKGIGNYASYLDAGYTDLPMVVVMIDNMAAFKEYFPEQSDELNALSREAQGVGISFVITAAMANTLNYRVQANFGRKYVLNCNDTSEYSTVFGHCKETPKEVRGRGLMLQDRRIVEWQTAIFGKSDKEAERNDQLRTYIELRNKELDSCARLIPMVPEKLELEAVVKTDKDIFRKQRILPLGINYSNVEYSFIDMNASSSLSLVGNSDGQVRLLNNLLRMLSKNIVFHNIEAIVIDDKHKKLADAESYGFVKRYTNDTGEALLLMEDFYSEVTAKEDNFKEDDTGILLILHNSEVLKQVCTDKNLSKEFTNVLKRISDLNAFMILSQVENQAVGFNASDVLKTLKEERSALLFAPIQDNKFFELPGRVRPDTNYEKSHANYFMDGTFTKIKIFE